TINGGYVLTWVSQCNKHRQGIRNAMPWCAGLCAVLSYSHLCAVVVGIPDLGLGLQRQNSQWRGNSESSCPAHEVLHPIENGVQCCKGTPRCRSLTQGHVTRGFSLTKTVMCVIRAACYMRF